MGQFLLGSIVLSVVERNHNIAKCRMGTNRCFWYGDTNHLIANFPARTTQPAKDHVQVPKQGKTIAHTTGRQVGTVYVINKKQVDDSGTVMTCTLTFNSTPLVVLFDYGVTHSFISSKAASQIG